MSSLKSYLAKIKTCLDGLPPNARQAVIQELRGHLEDRAADCERVDWNRRQA